MLLRNGKCRTILTANYGHGKWPLSSSHVHMGAIQKSYSQFHKELKRLGVGKHVAWNGIRSISLFDPSAGPSKYANTQLPSDAKVVICGGGVMGAAVAYHLALAGLGNETIILEQARYVSLLSVLSALPLSFFIYIYMNAAPAVA